VRLLQLTAQEKGFVVDCCANEVLRMSLPQMFEELEKCQKSLEGYLEAKRGVFPRFFFGASSVAPTQRREQADP